MEYEPQSIIERQQKPLFDAVLAHSFWISQIENPSGKQELFKQSLRSGLVSRAVALLYKNGKTEKIVIVGGKVKGPSYPSTASVMRNELLRKYEIPEKDVIVGPENEYNTEEEVKTLSELAQKNGWSNVVSVSFQTHEDSVKHALSCIPNNIQTSFLSVECIVKNYDDSLVQGLVKRLNYSKYQLGYMGYEAIKALFRNFPGIYERMLEKNEELRRTQNDNDSLVHLFDKFKS